MFTSSEMKTIGRKACRTWTALNYVELTDELAQNCCAAVGRADYLDVLQSTSITQIVTMTAGDTGYIIVQAPLGCGSHAASRMNPRLFRSWRSAGNRLCDDRDALCEAFGQNFYSPALQLYQKPALGVLPDSYNLSYDPKKSRELLSEAGYPDGIKDSSMPRKVRIRRDDRHR